LKANNKSTDMKTPERTIKQVFLLCTGLLLITTAICEAQLKKMSVEEMTTESTSILYGKCTKVESAWSGNQDIILTTVTVVPDAYLKGNFGSEVTITVPGGRVGDIIYEVSDMPIFTEGDDVFTFLWKHPSGMNLVTGGTQGKLDIVADQNSGVRLVNKRQPGTSTPIRANTQTTPKLKKAKKTSLDEFSTEVRGYLK
jgi:hypothetical protein